jgi:hypothetical protein
VADAGPAGHFCPTRTFEMVRGDFLAGSERKFVHKLELKVLKNWPAEVPLSQTLAL